jgi:6,7-dimethyl-8-ribityllumazine synthase
MKKVGQQRRCPSSWLIVVVGVLLVLSLATAAAFSPKAAPRREQALVCLFGQGCGWCCSFLFSSFFSLHPLIHAFIHSHIHTFLHSYTHTHTHTHTHKTATSTSQSLLFDATTMARLGGDDNGTTKNLRIGIIRTRWNDAHVSALVESVQTTLVQDCQFNATTQIFATTVPGAFELPLACRFLALSGTVDAIIAVGVLIKGETMHFEYIANAVSVGLMNVALQCSTPIVFGVLTCQTEKQVVDRYNLGPDWAKTAVEMALLRTEALGGKSGGGATKLEAMGFGAAAAAGEEKKKGGAFF